MGEVVLVDFEKGKCRKEPAGHSCTESLHDGKCPGAATGACQSPRFDPLQHNLQLPLFFAAQH